jgi:hypothetical protein
MAACICYVNATRSTDAWQSALENCKKNYTSISFYSYKIYSRETDALVALIVSACCALDLE